MATISRPNAFQRAKQFLIGSPLPIINTDHRTTSNKMGLAVFASDFLSSAAYATKSILEVLATTVLVLLVYIDKMLKDLQPNEMLTVVVPQFVSDNPLYNVLHMNTVLFLRNKPLNRPNIVVMEIPYHVHNGEYRAQENTK
jgi:hypothetical protein